jgi:Domain of unknown function (DUF4062)
LDKRYQVFVSSTFEDLQEERREVMHALLAMGCIPTGMELFPAADDESTAVIKRFIGECDYYVVIVGGRYGSTSPDGTSFTEMEYDYAVEAKLPVLAFLHGDPGSIPAKKTEQTDEGRIALARFREKIKTARHTKFWNSPKDLAGWVYQSMPLLMKSKPRTGWVRADRPTDESAAQEIIRLRKKIDDLETHIADTEMAAPAGTEELAQGEERISLHFRYEQHSRYTDGEESFSWNDILSILGPILIIQASEHDLKKKLAEAFTNRFKDGFGVQIFRAYMRDEEFQQVKLQLRAVGLIREVNGQSANAGNSALWALTPHGDRLMTQVAAIRSSART